MNVHTILAGIQNAQNINEIGDILEEATIFNYTQEKLDVQYDYQFQKQNHQFSFTDLDGTPVDLADAKDAIIAVVLNPDE